MSRERESRIATAQVAQELGVSSTTIQNIARGAGFRPRLGGFTVVQAEAIRAARSAAMGAETRCSASGLAKEMGLSVSTG